MDSLRLLVAGAVIIAVGLIIGWLGPTFYRLGQADLERRRERRKRRNPS